MVQRKMIQAWFGISLIALILVPGTVHAQYQVGQQVSDFTLQNVDGQNVSLSDFSGKEVMLNFFATW